jgi:hypothetical protein
VFPETGLLGQLRAKLTVHPYIPPICTLLLFWHLSYVLLRLAFHVRPEFAVLAANPIPAGVDELADEDLTTIAKRAMDIEGRGGPRLLTRRVFLAIQHLGISRDTSELGDLLRRRADADRQRSATAYLWPQFIVWAIPILGFVGTVMGIGVAVGGLSGAIGSEGAFGNALELVTSNLGVAFDTTLVALTMSIVALLAQTLVSQRESRLLADVEDYLTYRLQSRIRTQTLDIRVDNVLRESLAQLHTLQEKMQDEHRDRTSVAMQSIMRGQQGLQETVSKLPELLKEVSATSANLLTETRDQLSTIGQHAATGIQQVLKQGVEDTRGDLAGMRGKLLEDSSRQTSELLRQHAAQYREVLSPVGQGLQQLTEGLQRVFTSSEQLRAAEKALTESLTAASRTQAFDEVLGKIDRTLASLTPALEKLARPVPVRLTLAGLDVSDANAQRPTPQVP